MISIFSDSFDKSQAMYMYARFKIACVLNWYI